MVALTELSEAQRHQAMRRYEVLRPHLEGGVPLTRAAREADVSEKTARRWLARYRAGGLAGLARARRADRGTRRAPPELVELIEALALARPAPAIAHVHRRAVTVAGERGWAPPSYAAVRSIIQALDPGLTTLAHRGPAAYRDGFELALRREASAPNAIWQADHTQLDVMVLDPTGRPARPWLTIVLDDFSRAVAGYAVFLEAPSALQTSLALRQAIWRKESPAWPVCGLPEVLYTDHGSDFTSRHLEQVLTDLHVCLVFSTPGVPQGRGKIERFFGTVTTELLPELPGHLAPGRAGAPPNPPRLTLAELDTAIGRYLAERYHSRPHSQTGQPPLERWAAGGWLPRMPQTLEQLDLLLLTVARPRRVQRHGIELHGLRYVDLALADYVGEAVTVRYDPRDLAEIRIFHHDRLVCRAVNAELADRTISLRELQSARTARRRALRTQLRQRRSLVDATPQVDAREIPPATELLVSKEPPPPPPPPASRLRRYQED